MSPEGGINPMSGTVAFNKPLVSITSGAISASFNLSYSGNVFKTVQNRNDLASSGWVGLGWALGRAKIICDHNGSMNLADDSYSLLSAEGTRYKIINDGSRWWIENLPYWKVQRITKKATWNNKEYEIVVGWLIIDDSGLKYWYGDYEDDPKNPKRNATQHVLAWPETYGLVGKAWGGNPALYPTAWNLAKQEDLDGNWLKYEYKQEYEGLKIKSWTSAYQYTKECYLQFVKSSMGSSIEFVLADKGTDDFDGEYWDATGNVETIDETVPDAFIDPMERMYLSAIKIKGIDGTNNGQIDFCYKPLAVKPSGKVLDGYVKRLLVSVIHSNKLGIETDREDYSYYTDVNKAAFDKKYPLGALYEIQGPNCGRVEYTYDYRSVVSTRNSLHSQTIDLTKVALGYLDNGTPYLVGLNNTKKGILVYAWQNGGWTLINQVANVPYNSDGSFLIGDNGWFAYNNGDTMYPIVWNGKNWVVQDSINDSGSRTVVAVGPDYIAKARLSGDNILLTIPWSRWGKKYEVDAFEGENGYLDCQYLRLSVTQNHLALFYLGPNYGNNGRLTIFTFDHSADTLANTYYSSHLDDDNTYFWGDGYLFGATESAGLYGSIVRAWHWNGKSWDRKLEKDLHGVQGVPTVQAYGDNYFAVRHNDKDDLSLFDWNGEDWKTPYKNKNLVSHDDLDFWFEAEWTGETGRDFFIAREPKVDRTQVTVCYPVFRRWKVRKRCKDITVWSSTYHGALVERFERRDGEWSRSGAKNLDGTNEKTSVMTGENWYAEKKSNKAFVWNGLEWKEENLGDPFVWNSDSKSLGGDFFAVESNGETAIYYKKEDSFTGDMGVHLVTGKKIYDPVADKIIEYGYDYNFADTQEKVQIDLDYINNTPLIQQYSITLPESGGRLKKTLCPANNADFGLGMGQVCKEEMLNADGVVEKSNTITFERYRNPSWPLFIYQDRVAKTESVIKGVISTTETQYQDDLNGMPSSIKYKVGKNILKGNEKRIVYAAGVYDFMHSANRLKEEAAYYTCIPQCQGGTLVDAEASRFGYTSVASKANILDVWSFQPQNMPTLGSLFSFDWSSGSQASTWKRNTSYTKYAWGRAVESIDRLGRKSSLIYENKADGFLLGSVINAGIGESLLLSGETCNVSNWNSDACETVNLSGNATKGIGIDYGRFSKTAIRISPSKTLTGTLTSSKGGSYRFSAWVQIVDAVDRNILFALNGTQINSWTIPGADAGKWKYVEWEGVVSEGSLVLTLAMPIGTEARLQDIRFLPSDASSTVSFWDRQWGVPVVQVDDRGVGKYTTLDEIGRPLESYVEDESGNVFLASRKTYFKSDCRENSSGKGTLGALSINGKTVPIPSAGGTQYYTLSGTESELLINWKPTQQGDQIRYQLYPAGSVDTSWYTSCCTELEGVSKSTENVSSWVLNIDVAPFQSSVYTFYIQKSNTGWVDYGAPLNKGVMPRYIGDNDSTQIIYMGNDSLQTAAFNGNGWTESNIALGDFEFLATAASGSSRYILSVPDFPIVEENTNENALVYSGFSSTWSSLGPVADSGWGRFYRLALDSKGVPYVLYERMDTSFGTDTTSHSVSSLVAVRYNSTQAKWELAGSLPVFENDSTPPLLKDGGVSDSSVTDADIVLGPDNHLYVAYIGSLLSMRNFIDDSSVAMPKFVIVKRLFESDESKVGREIWAGPTLIQDSGSTEMLPNYLGDILALDSVPIMRARRVKLASDGVNLYLAIVQNLDNDSLMDRTALSVFKGVYTNSMEDGLNQKILKFEPLLDTSVKQSVFSTSLAEEQRIVAYLDDSDPFDFVVKNGIPYISFANSNNNDRLSVVRYSGNRWLSVGNPAFASAAQGLAESDLAIGKNGTPAVVFRESKNSKNTKRRNHIVPMKYVSANDYDLTLSSIGLSGGNTTLVSEFRQYILNYSAKVLATENALLFSPVPKTLNDVIALQIENNDSLISSWIISPSSSEATRYLSGVNANFTGTSVPSMAVPLSEGLNDIKVKITGKNGSVLYYTFILNRAYLPDAEEDVYSDSYLTVVNEKSDSTITYDSTMTSDSTITYDTTVVRRDTAVYVSYGSDSIRVICIQFTTGWHLIVGDSIYYQSKCLELNPSDSCRVTLSDSLGNTKVIIIEDGDDPSRGGADTLTGGGNAPGEGDDGAIPSGFKNLSAYRLFSAGDLILADRARISGGSYGGSFVEAGANSSVSGDIVSSGNVNLRSYASVGKITLAGSLETQAGASYGTVTQTSVSLPAIPTVNITYGDSDEIVNNNQTVSMTAGYYKDFHAYSGSTVTFGPGDYYFNSFVVEPDVSIHFNNASEPVRLWVQGSVSFADRVNLYNAGVPEMLFIYTNSPNILYLGVGSIFSATYVAPNGGVSLATRAQWTGSIWANTLTIQADAVVE